jgi:predicted membrane protein
MKHLIADKLFVSLFVVQFLVGSVLPFLLLGTAVVFKDRIPAGVRNVMGFVSGLLLLVQVLAMRWNVVVGGQMYSKSFRGFVDFRIDIYGREGLFAVLFIFSLPFVAMLVFSRILPLWGSIATFPKHWLKEADPTYGPLKSYSSFGRP